MTANAPNSAARWLHHDGDLSARTERAGERALSGDWQSGPLADRAADLQAIVAETAYLMAKLAGSTSRITKAGEETLFVDPRPEQSVPQPRRAMSARLYRTLTLLARGTQQADVETFAPGPPSETAGLPLVGLVAVIVVGGAAIAYVGHEAAKVVDRQLARSAASDRLMAAHAAALDVIDAHTTREDEQGKQLPLDPASRQVLDALGSEQETLAKSVEPQFGGDLIPQGSSPWTFSTGALTGLALAAAGLLAFKLGVV